METLYIFNKSFFQRMDQNIFIIFYFSLPNFLDEFVFLVLQYQSEELYITFDTWEYRKLVLSLVSLYCHTKQPHWRDNTSLARSTLARENAAN